MITESMSAEFAEMTENSETTMNEDATVQEIDSSMSAGESIDIDIETASEEMDSQESASANANPDVELKSAESSNTILEDQDVEGTEEILAPEADGDVVTQLATEVESLRLQVEERTSQCMRIAADFDNFRKRTDREKSDLELRVKRDAISELLPVIDSFERARTQIKPQTEEEINIHKSYQGVYKQLVDCLKRVGVSPMRVEGQPFDPNYHDAIMREATDEHPEGTVMEELRRGYLLGDLVLRHAMVKVATPAEESTASEVADASVSDDQASG
jgi:molecular chaperone GrpE